MAVPKRKTTKSKRDSRRTHDKLQAVNLVECPRCHSKKVSHRVCPSCGYYNNNEIINLEEKSRKKEKKEKQETRESENIKSDSKSASKL